MDKNNLKDLEQLDSKITSIMEQSEREALFTDSANKLFELNIRAFQKYFPDIAEKFLSHQPSEKFNLFLNDNGQANIIDYSTGVPFYRDNIEKQIEEQVQSSIDNPIFSKINYSYLENLDNPYDFMHVDLIKDAGAAYNQAKNNLEGNSCLDSKLPSVVIFGVGLGYHLDKLLVNWVQWMVYKF